MIHRVVPTVGKHVIAQEALAGGGVAVCVDETGNAGIIVTALQVVEIGFSVLVVPSVSQGIYVLHAARSAVVSALGAVNWIYQEKNRPYLFVFLFL